MSERIDCSNIFTFQKEWERRRKTDTDEDYIKLNYGYGLHAFNPFIGNKNLETYVSELQEWSDKHPKTTRKDKFKKMCEENGFLLDCYKDKNDFKKGCISCVENHDCPKCKEYWNEYV